MTLAEEFARFLASKYNRVVAVVGNTVSGTALGTTIEKLVGPNGKITVSLFGGLPKAPQPGENKQ